MVAKIELADYNHALSDLFILRGVPGHVRSDNGPEFIAKAVRGLLQLSAPRPRRAVEGL